jgi:uncharacterized protein (TIGR02594 family)
LRVASEPLWLSVGRAFVGVTEIPGAMSNPAILRWAVDINAPAFTNDDTAWCAVWANRLFQACQLPMSGTGFDLVRARSFLDWGQPLSAPALGCVLVFKRPEGHHVGLYVGERADAYLVLGGNQSNAVGYTWIAKDRLVGCRWPTAVALPQPNAVLVADAGGQLSTNEA